jgi:hypothetical protein
MMKIIMCIIFVLLLSGTLPAQGKDKESNGSIYKFKLGILYINSPTGERFRDGIKEAIKKYNEKNKDSSEKKLFNPDPPEIPYDNETDGLNKLVSKIRGKKVDIILGPTESGVFVRALEKRKELAGYEIPVISSQVAAKVPHQKGGWFFRTNINVENRAQVIYDYLNKYWIRSIAVIYEDNEFGRRAEEAFRKELRGQQKELYLPLSYNSIDTARNQIRLILEQRPEAVGILGNRRDFVELYSLLKSLNAGSSSYFPQIFSVIDIRTIRRYLQGNLRDDNSVHFVSVTDIPKKEDFDDVKALAYDTTWLILRELDNLESKGFKYENGDWRQKFRNRFESILNGNIKPVRGGTKTGISFKNYENETPPKVFKLSKDVTSPVKLEEAIGFWKKLGHKIEYIRKRFGVWPILNFILIFLVVLFMSVKDIKRWWWGKSSRFFLRLHFWILFSVNLAIAYAAYIYLGETGNIRYDSVLTALILSLSASAVLHITLFETSTGKAIGLARHYDNFLQWVYEKITVKNYLKHQRYINIIAYQNSVYGMKCRLKEIYQNTPNKEQSTRMQRKIEDVLKDADSWIERRKVLARLLFQKLKWQELIECNFVPDNLKEFNPNKINDHPADPEEIALETARCCLNNPLLEKSIDRRIDNSLAQLSDERKEELENEHKKDLNEMKTPTAKMRKKIIFLFLVEGYDPDFLEDMCCTKKNKDCIDHAVKHCSDDPERKDKVREIVEDLKKEILKENPDEQKEYEEILKKIGNPTENHASLKRGLSFILYRKGCVEKFLKDNDLLPKDYIYKEEKKGWLKKMSAWFKKKLKIGKKKDTKAPDDSEAGNKENGT